jgi:hypothetical protein
MPATSEDDGNILHEVDVEESVKAELEETGGVAHTNAHIADASVAHALNATFSDTEVEAALNALGVKLNAVIAALQANGILAAS